MDISQFEMRIRDVGLDASHGTQTLKWTMEVLYQPLDIVLSSHVYSLRPKRGGPGHWESIDAQLYSQAQKDFSTTVGFCWPREFLDGKSFYEINLDLAHWSFTTQVEDGRWTLEHPICGVFEGVDLPIDSNGKPMLIGRWRAIIDRVLPAPLWLWADSPYGGQLRVRCVAVPNAVSYNIYSETELLGEVLDNQWNTVSVPSGYYVVRVAGVDINGQVGCLSPMVPMTVPSVTMASLGRQAKDTIVSKWPRQASRPAGQH